MPQSSKNAGQRGSMAGQQQAVSPAAEYEQPDDTVQPDGRGTRTTNRQEMEHRILVGAARLFRRKGFAGATTRELAESLGLQRASLYHYLDSKQNLLFDMCVLSLETSKRGFEEAVKGAKDEDKLRAAVRGHISNMVENQDANAVMMTEMRSLDAHRRQDVLALRADYDAGFRKIVRADQEAGRIRSDINDKYLTLMLLNLLNWTGFWYKQSGPLNPGEMADLLVTVFMEGASTR